MGFLPVDQITAKEHQQMARAAAQRQAKNSSAVSAKKVLAIVVPVFIAALVLVLYLCGAFSKGYNIWWNNGLYHISDSVTDALVPELPDGFVEAGQLVYAENPQKTKENLSSNWTLESRLYVNHADDSIVYFTAYNGYVRVKKK